MKQFIPIGIAVLALAATAGAQDTTVKSRTKVKADEGQVMTLTGCLRHDALSGDYTLFGTAVVGDELQTQSKVSTDVDRDNTTVTTKSKTKVENGKAMSTFVVIPRNEVDLASQVGHEVQLSAVMVDPHHHDADVKIKDKPKTEPEHGRDTTSRATTKLEVPRGAAGQYSVIAMRSLANTCDAR